MPIASAPWRSDLRPLPVALAALLLMALGIQLARHAEPVEVDAFFTLPKRAAPVPVGVPRDYPAIDARPLFTPTRGTVAAAGSSDGTAPGLDSYALLGTATGGGRAVAMLRGPVGVIDLHPGQSVGGWRLVAIRGDSVLLEQGGVRRSLAVGAAAGPTVP